MKCIEQYARYLACLSVLLLCVDLSAQTYEDHFGAGHDQGMSVTSSPVTAANDAIQTVNGTAHFPDLYGASRFLAQSTFGADYESIDYVRQVGIDAWLDAQFAAQGTSFSQMVANIRSTAEAEIAAEFGSSALEDVYWGSDIINLAFWQKVLTENDQLRQRVALALSEILVISQQADQLDRADVVASYYDILYTGAFGNYRDILHAVTLHPAMGVYLSHFNNHKTDYENNVRPDENYAREIMQLFSIGLHELNIDGSERLDAYGNPIPTYDNEDIREFAKVFTGLSGAAWNLEDYPEFAGMPMAFDYYFDIYDRTIPMAMYEDHHEPGPKYLLDNYLVPAGQTGMQDIEDAIDHLFNHPNVGPFIGYRLIQFLVKSNPSPAYVSRVAGAFNNNGYNQRGDLRAVVKAILTDPEARDCGWIDTYDAGKLREPLIKYAHLLRAFNITNQSGRFWWRDNWGMLNDAKQSFLHSPSVFNFFRPDYAPAGLSGLSLVGPEFQMLDANTSIHYINQMQGAAMWNPMWIQGTVDPNEAQFYAYDYGPTDQASLDFSDEIAAFQSGGTNGLLDRLDLILTHGQISEQARAIIKQMLDQMNALNWMSDQQIVEWAIYVVMISPNYVILK